MCSVDYNAYTESPNPKPDATGVTMRSSGLHLHFGYKNPNVEESVKLVKYCDAFICIPSMRIDNDIRRKQLYGKAGCFRLCPYGVEYRTLSGAFNKSDEALGFLWDAAMRAVDACNNNLPLPDSDLVQKCINEGDMELAEMLIAEYNLD